MGGCKIQSPLINATLRRLDLSFMLIYFPDGLKLFGLALIRHSMVSGMAIPILEPSISFPF